MLCKIALSLDGGVPMPPLLPWLPLKRSGRRYVYQDQCRSGVLSAVRKMVVRAFRLEVEAVRRTLVLPVTCTFSGAFFAFSWPPALP